MESYWLLSTNGMTTNYHVVGTFNSSFKNCISSLIMFRTNLSLKWRQINKTRGSHLVSDMRVQSEIVRDSSAIRRLFLSLTGAVGRQRALHKENSGFSNSESAHFHVSWLSDFIFSQKPLYKSLPQSFFYSFITIFPSESGVTLHYSTILP